MRNANPFRELPPLQYIEAPEVREGNGPMAWLAWDMAVEDLDRQLAEASAPAVAD